MWRRLQRRKKDYRSDLNSSSSWPVGSCRVWRAQSRRPRHRCIPAPGAPREGARTWFMRPAPVQMTRSVPASPPALRTAACYKPLMSSTIRSLISGVTLTLIFTGCEDRRSDSAQVVAASAPSNTAAPATDKWHGKWSAPEGTFLQLAGGNGKYQVTIQNLDGPRTFQGNAVGDQIEFERNGIKESLRATNGAETGMKWLSEKSNCLTIRAGEGYCRD